MIKRANLSRRQFLQSTSTMTGASWLKLTAPALAAITQAACTAKQESSSFKVLGTREAKDFAAIASRVIPTTDTPGAAEAGVIYFIDNAFAAEMSDRHEEARSGLALFNSALAAARPGAGELSDLSATDQDAFLTTQQSTVFFKLVRDMTIYGFFAMPKYGGNKDNIGWDLIGFEGDHGGWRYPFGYYDAQVHDESGHGE